jgi:hypothetical protein
MSTLSLKKARKTKANTQLTGNCADTNSYIINQEVW